MAFFLAFDLGQKHLIGNPSPKAHCFSQAFFSFLRCTLGWGESGGNSKVKNAQGTYKQMLILREDCTSTLDSMQ